MMMVENFFLWESRCEDCEMYTLVQCVACPLSFAVLSPTLVFGLGEERDGEGWGVQFDSDYSGGEGASPFYFLQVSGGFSLWHLLAMDGGGDGLGYC